MKKILIVASFLFYSVHGYTQIKKEISEYAEQKAISNDIAAKTNVIPFNLPDWKSMVSLNESGDGNINIPVVTVKSRKLSLPISLSYNTNGIKVDQNASEVGLGWNINFGSIVRDYGAYEPDYTYTGKETKMLHPSGVDPGGTLYSTFTNSPRPINPWNQNKQLHCNSVIESYTPDIYHLSIPGASGNSFWNKIHDNDAEFIFTETNATKIAYEKQTFTISQDPSVINELAYAVNSIHGYQPLATDELWINSNLTAGIGVYPYVINQKSHHYISPSSSGVTGIAQIATLENGAGQSELTTVTYEDYSKFVITQPDGTQYIFGRPLRSQKYLISEEPFWSALKTPPSLNNVLAGEHWKTDFISEWLLTEIRSNDYIDANQNQMVDDGDFGDWIRIEYSAPYKYVVPLGVFAPFKVPKYREWMNFTQTDQASSLMKENAYVEKIITPLETIDFASSERFDVNHYYFDNIFNRLSLQPNKQQEYAYNLIRGPINPAYPWSGGSCQGYFSGMVTPGTQTVIPAIDYDRYLGVRYPVETKKYDDLKVKENISDLKGEIQNIKLVYAQKGSPAELAVSNYLILDNTKNFTPYDPASIQVGLSDANFHKPDDANYNGRGKTTLLGIEYRGTNAAAVDKISYKFNYAVNPKYDDIHLFQIQNMGANPTVREANKITEPRWPNVRLVWNGGTPRVVPNSISNWKTLLVGKDKDFTSTINWGNPVRSDELGYFYDNGRALNGRDAWTLTSIDLPYGGNISIKYELDATDIVADRLLWLRKNTPTIPGGGIADYCIPAVAVYNNIAHMRSIAQDRINDEQPVPPAGTVALLKHTYQEYYQTMDAHTGGLRIKEIKFKDLYSNKELVKVFNYGSGHYTMPPADFWQNYLNGFSAFLYNERVRHRTDERCVNQFQNADLDIYTHEMLRLVSNTRIDNTIKQAKHYYESITEKSSDNSSIKRYFGRLYNNCDAEVLAVVLPTTDCSVVTPVRAGCIKTDYNDRLNLVDVLNTSLDNSKQVGNYKTDYLDNQNRIVKQEYSNYSFSDDVRNVVSLNKLDIAGVQYAPWIKGVSSVYGNSFLEVPNTDPNWLFNTAEVCDQTKQLFDHLSDLVLEGIDYKLPSSAALNVVEQARNPVVKLGVGCGAYNVSALPSWFSSINATSTATTTPQSIYLTPGLQTKFNLMFNMQKDQAYRCRILDDNFQIPAETYISHQSYTLRPTRTKTITKFYN